MEERKDKLAGTILIIFNIKMYKWGCRHNLGLKYILEGQLNMRKCCFLSIENAGNYYLINNNGIFLKC